jgi:hypothetical protein
MCSQMCIVTGPTTADRASRAKPASHFIELNQLLN